MFSRTAKRRPASETIDRIAAEIENFKNAPYPRQPSIAAAADAIAEQLGLRDRDREMIVQAARLVGIGEVPDRRNGSDGGDPGLVAEQRAADAGLPLGIRLLLRWHRESWNGHGTPDRLRGEDIPLGARIIRVAEAVAELAAGAELDLDSHHAVRHEMITRTGLEFDPQVVRALFESGHAGPKIDPEPMIAEPEPQDGDLPDDAETAPPPSSEPQPDERAEPDPDIPVSWAEWASLESPRDEERER